MSAVLAHREPFAAPSGTGDDRQSRTLIERTARAEWTRATLGEARRADAERQRELRQLVVTEHLWLALALAARYRNRGVDEDDLAQVASTALVEAALRFDPEQGDFIGFAVPTIHGTLKRHFRDHGWLVRPPRRTQELAGDVRRSWAELAQQLQREPTDDDLATSLAGGPEEIRRAQVASEGYHGLSLDLITDPGRPSSGGGSRLAAEAADSEGAVAACESHLVAVRAFELLGPDERRLLWLRYFEDRSQAEIARLIGTSQMQVSRLLARTLVRLRELLGVDLDDDGPSALRPAS